MKRPLPLEISGAASRNDAYADVLSLVHRDADEGIRCGCAAHGSLRRSRSGIITGKSWTNALQAYRLITTVLLQDFFQSGAKTYQELTEYWEAIREHPVGRLWVDCLSMPTLLALQLLRAQRDGDFLLQQVSLEAMVPYFFAAGHMNYARYITWYLRNVKNLPTTARTTQWRVHMYVVTQTVGRQGQPTNSENKHTSGEGRVQAG